MSTDDQLHADTLSNEDAATPLDAKQRQRAERERKRQDDMARQIGILNSGSHKQRESAVDQLGKLRAHPSILLPLLQDPHTGVRSAAALAIGNCDITGSREEVAEALLSALDDRSDDVVKGAIWSLGMLRIEEARDQLLPFLDDRNTTIVEVAIVALARTALAQHVEEGGDPVPSSPGGNLRSSPVPAELRGHVPELLASLNLWSYGLQRDRATGTSDDHPAISAALSVLIFALEREQIDLRTGSQAISHAA